jgi:hypothetical protein
MQNEGAVIAQKQGSNTRTEAFALEQEQMDKLLKCCVCKDVATHKVIRYAEAFYEQQEPRSEFLVCNCCVEFAITYLAYNGTK